MMPNSSDRKSTRLNSSHGYISYAVFCLKKKNKKQENEQRDQETPRTMDRTSTTLVPRPPRLRRAAAVPLRWVLFFCFFCFFFFNDTATTEIYTLSLHDALPIFRARVVGGDAVERAWASVRVEL